MGTGFLNYELFYGWHPFDQPEPADWSSGHFELIDGGLCSVEHGILGYFNIAQAGITEPGLVTLRLDLHTEYTDDTEYVSFYVDPRLHEGWPIGGEYTGMYGVPYDADNDGAAEILARSWIPDREFYIFEHDATPLPGFPVDIYYDSDYYRFGGVGFTYRQFCFLGIFTQKTSWETKGVGRS